MHVGWILLGVVVVAIGVGLIRVVRSKWRPVQGRDPEARQAEARLWSTLNSNRR